MLVACGGEKNTSDTDAATGTEAASTATPGTTTATAGTTSEPTTSVTDGDTDPSASSTPTTTQTSQVTGESSSSDGSTSSGTSEPGTTSATATTGTGETEESGTGDSSTGGDPLTDAVVQNDCAPNDGPALQFQLEVETDACGTDVTGDQLRLMLWEGGPLAPGDYVISQQTGIATFQVGNDEPVVSTSGTLTISSWDGDLVTGSYDLTFADKSTRTGGFAGPFCLVMIGCG